MGVCSYSWPVVPLCARQRRDVREEDLIENGLFRRCNVSRSRDQRDNFGGICRSRLGRDGDWHFVAQLYGCVLSCPYCYVTPNGIFGDPEIIHSADLVRHYHASNLPVFHLMGGAPGLYLENWSQLTGRMSDKDIFHSDLLLVEQPYKSRWLLDVLLRSPADVLVAINIKGTDSGNFRVNTGKPMPSDLFWKNFERVSEALDMVQSNIDYNPFYVTFTDPNPDTLPAMKEQIAVRVGEEFLEDCFVIDSVHYRSLE